MQPVVDYNMLSYHQMMDPQSLVMYPPMNTMGMNAMMNPSMGGQMGGQINGQTAQALLAQPGVMNALLQHLGVAQQNPQQNATNSQQMHMSGVSSQMGNHQMTNQHAGFSTLPDSNSSGLPSMGDELRPVPLRVSQTQ